MADKDVDRLTAELVCLGLWEGTARVLAEEAPASSQSLLDDCSPLELDLSGWDASGVSDMVGMFADCTALQRLDLSGWDVSGIWDMYGMFEGCGSLESLDLSGWDVSGVEDMGRMFKGCASLVALNLSGWHVSCADAMYSMFEGCGSLESLDLSGWDVSGAEDTYDEMSDDCFSPEPMDPFDWDAPSAPDTRCMFRGCKSLRELRVPHAGYLGCEETGAADSLPAGARIVVPTDLLDRYREDWGSRGFEVVA